MAEIAASPSDLPLEGKGQRSSAWWGVLCLIATEAILFVYLIFSYAYLGTQVRRILAADRQAEHVAGRAGYDRASRKQLRSGLGVARL